MLGYLPFVLWLYALYKIYKKMKRFEYKVLKDKVFQKNLIAVDELNRLGKQVLKLVSTSP